MSGAALMVLPEAEAALAAVHTVPEVKVLLDQAKVIGDLAKRQRRGLDVQNRVAEFKLRCERKLGRLLAEQVAARGRCLRDEITGEMRGAARTLPGGVTPTQSHRYQRAASVPEHLFQDWMAETRERDGELTSAGLLALAAPSPPDGATDDDAGVNPGPLTSAQPAGDELPRGYAQRLILTFDEDTHRRIVRWLTDLGREFGTSNPSTTLVALMNRR